MRLILGTFIIGIALIPLISSTPVSLGDGFYLPTVDNLESHIGNLWSNFKKGYGIVYNTTMEELHRFKIFANHVKLIVKHNLEHDLGLHTFRLGINKYAAMVKSTLIQYEEFFYLFRQIKNFVRNSMVIDVIKMLVYLIRMFVVYIFQLHPMLLFLFLLIGVIKVSLHPLKIKPNVVHVGHLAL